MSCSRSKANRDRACGCSWGERTDSVRRARALGEIGPRALREIDPTGLLVSGEPVSGAAIALPQTGRALAVEVQALVAPAEGAPRRQTTGLDLRRFQVVAALVQRVAGLPLARAELYGASSGGIRVEDPACDLAVTAALASAASGVPAPAGSAFVGEVALTGLLRPASGMDQRLAAARAAGCTRVYAVANGWEPTRPTDGRVRVVDVRDVRDALAWASQPSHLWKSGEHLRSA
jgi:DNA repair protein RadA/Sms